MTKQRKFIEKSKSKFPNQFTYNDVNYVNKSTDITICCNTHGNFVTKPRNHLRTKTGGCPYCTGTFKRDTKWFITEASKIHNNEYLYNSATYVDSHKTKITITCKKHGDFEMLATNHLHGKQGCPVCRRIKQAEAITFVDTKLVIERATLIFGDEFDYSLLEYNGYNNKFTVICKKHGEFKTTHSQHIEQQQGCPACNSSKGERTIANYLIDNNVNFVQQYCCNIDNSKHYYDFYLPDYNILIEYDGIQHYKRIDFFHKTEDDFIKQKKRDADKDRYASDNNYKLYRILYNQDVNKQLKLLLNQ